MSPSRLAACIATFAATALLLASCDKGDPEPPSGSRKIEITTAGGDEVPAIEVGSGGRVVVLSHGATGTKEDFFGLAGVFAEDGWRAIAYDAPLTAREDDLRAVVAYARDSGATSVVLVGGSLGASLSISMAAELEVQAVVSLSAPASSFGALEAAGAIGDSIPVLVAVAEGNQPYAADAVKIADALGTSATIVSGDRHGTGMFRDHPELMDAIVAFADGAIGQA
jgi:dienelactone hydrolase